MVLVQDLLHPNPSSEKQKNKLKRLVQGPNSYFLDIKCPSCFTIKTVFSHAQTAVACDKCSTLLCTPTAVKLNSQKVLLLESNNFDLFHIMGRYSLILY